MAFEQRNMTGTLFPNDYKREDKHPDFKGKCLVNGEVLDFAAWWKDGNKGQFLSVSFSPPQQREGQQDQAPQRQQNPPPRQAQRPVNRPAPRQAPQRAYGGEYPDMDVPDGDGIPY